MYCPCMHEAPDAIPDCAITGMDIHMPGHTLLSVYHEQCGDDLQCDPEPEPCPAGTYSLGGVFPCELCPAGSFSPAVGATSAAACISCPAGTFSAREGATSHDACELCQAGSFPGSAE